MNGFKFDFKNKLISALMVAPSLSLMLFSSVYQLTTSENFSIKTGAPLALGILSIIVVLISLVPAVLYRKDIVPMVYAVLYGLAFICYLVFYISGKSDVLNDGFFEIIMLILALPIWSYMSLSSAISANAAVPSLAIAALISVLCIALTFYIILARKKEKKEIARAEEEYKRKIADKKARNSRRKV